MHYAGVSCDMDAIAAIARPRGIAVVEDAAQGVNARYKGRSLGAIGDLGAYSFHETKNYVCGEGGALLVNRPELVERAAEIIREKGTNRSRFYRGQVDKYTWVDIGSSYLPSELNAAYLLAQLECMDQINEARMRVWNAYREGLSLLESAGWLELPKVPEGCEHNAYMFYIKLANLEVRTRLIDYLKSRGIGTVFHYIPLHSLPAGLRYGCFHGEDCWTTRESERLLRLPIHYDLSSSEVERVVDEIVKFFG